MTAITGSGTTILLVDDQHAIRHMLSAGLKAQGFDVLTAGSAEKAMFCAGYEGRIDLLLSDSSLTPQELWPENPGQTGWRRGSPSAQNKLWYLKHINLISARS